MASLNEKRSRTPQQAPSRAAVLPLVGSELAFDLTNTASGRGGPRWLEHLQTAEDVIDWARHAKVLTEKDHRQLRGRLAANRRLASALLARTLGLRDLIYAIGVAIASGSRPRGRDMDRLVRIHADCLARGRLIPTVATFAWVWNPAETPVEAILGPIALSALSLLSGADLSRIKRCPGDHCGWLFFDTTKNKRRRWCEMEVCGNRAKQKRRRERGAGRMG
jgi:predicted RNA-binding Zn ribbon-like protein